MYQKKEKAKGCKDPKEVEGAEWPKRRLPQAFRDTRVNGEEVMGARRSSTWR
jgi:hypothetical protein